MVFSDLVHPIGMKVLELLRKLASDPTVQFIAVGIIAALVFHLFGPDAQRRIVVSPERIAQIERGYKGQFGVIPNDQRRDWLVNDFVNQEVLYREAVRQGLDRDDEVVKRRMVQKMEFLLDGTVREPDEAALRSYYDANRSRYSAGAGVTFTHVFFADKPDRSAAKERALVCARTLTSESASTDPVKACPNSDTSAFPGPPRFELADRQALVRVFGDTPVVDAALSPSGGRTSAPVRSAYGWHILVVEHRSEARSKPYDEIRSLVREDWIAAELASNREKSLSHLRARYEVLREDR